MLPHGGHDEEQLREDGTEREDAAHEGREDPADVPRLRGDLARDLVRAHWQRDRSLLVPEERPQEHERHRDAEPEDEEGEHRGEGHCPGRLGSPDEQIQEEEDPEDSAGIQERRHQRRLLPILALPHLVEAGRRVARQDAGEREEQQHTLEDRAAVHGGQEAGGGEDEGHGGANQQLHAGANCHGQGLGMRRLAEDVAVHKLPSGLLGRVLSGHVVVLGDVPVQRA
mmetsp:Transcript_47564/g.122886  ORF Transcript_47564/g.122886 Transcript_47564/m.122886 type:complete len:226 (+) Transcript_47564:444-1121(+)